MRLTSYKNPKDRRSALEGLLNLDLKHIANYSMDESRASRRNCENMIGAIQVPLGIAGPLLLSSGTYYVPLATTEAALVASVNRGCKALSVKKNVEVKVERIGVTRAPVFFVENSEEAERLTHWVNENFESLQDRARATSKHLQLKKYEIQHMGRNVFISFYFDSQDAMGMNMATIATSQLVSFIEREQGSSCVSLSSNFCSDKKPSFAHFIKGRGYKVWAECVLTESVIKDVLRTTSMKLIDVGRRKLQYGSVMAGSLGYNAHYANILASFFLATGQDLAHVAECAIGVTTIEEHKNGAYMSVYLPDLMVGTVGGGTELDTQKEALSILGVRGGNEGKNAEKLASIVGATVLAGEVSLLASLADNSLANAHKRLARG